MVRRLPASSSASSSGLPAGGPGRVRRSRGLPRLAGLLALLALALPPAARAELPFEYQVKTGYLFNFAKFVDWPAGTLDPGQSLRLGVIGEPGIAAGIADSLAGKSVQGHPLAVVTIDPAAPGEPPHILFVQRGAELDGAAAAALFPGHPVLVVGETSGFASAGGAIGFVFRGDSLRFQVNIRATADANLKLNSQIANLAEIVRPRR